MFNRYGAICAEIYDIDKPLDRPRPEVAFFRERLVELRGPILEPAVGSGRILVPLLEAGLDVRGFDRSEPMLASCRERCHERGLTPELRCASFDDFEYESAFAAVIVPSGSFTLIDAFDDAVTALERFRRHLEPGGLLMLEVGALEELRADAHRVRSWITPNGDTLTMEVSRSETDFVQQRFASHLRYERWRAGRLIETELDVMSQRAWGLRELELALRSTGFEDVVVTGDHRRERPIHARTRSFTFEARRA